MSSPSSANDLLLFWFGPRPYTPERTQSHLRLWFGDANAPELTPQTDELIRERFGELTDQASRGALSDWESSARRRLALIVVLDQFSRNIYRGSDRAFAQDLRALQLTVSGMQVGADATLDPVERLFFYMPLMHAESRAVQDESVAAFRRLLEESPTELRATFQASVDSAVEHRNVIERFGRFPSRNILLGRDSTPDEMDWLRGEGRDFAN